MMVLMTRLRKCLLVGHCTADAFSIEALVERACEQLPVLHVADQAELDQEATPESLLLVNRVLDGDFDCDEGVELIRRVARRAAEGAGDGPVMMLISNIDVAQREAIEAGAVTGFGKNALYAEATATHLRQVVEAGGAG